MKRLHSRLRSSASQLSPDGFAPASLALDFLGTSNTLDNRITFSRGSQATLTDSTGKLTYAPNNLLTNSESFEAAAWAKTNATVTANSTTAPDGTTTADTMIASAGSSVKHLSQNVSSISSSVPHVFSFYVKAGTHNFIQLVNTGDPAAYANFDVLNGTAGTTGSSTTASIISIGNGWYRCFAVFDASATLSAVFRIYLVPSATAAYGATLNAIGSEDVYIWGAQLEAVTYQTTPGTYNSTTPKNLLGYTQEFDNAAWAKSNATVTANAVVAPDGSMTADKLVENTASATHYAAQGATTTAGPVTYSVYLKAGERSFAMLFSNGPNIGQYFNLADGTFGNVAVLNAPTSASMTPVGNGWYRCSITYTATAVSSSFRVYTMTNETTFSYTGDGTSGIYIWGAQLSNSASVDPYSYNPGAAPTSTAYYGPRFDYDPVTLQQKGLLIEEQRTNLLLRSENFTTSWGAVSTTVTANTTVAPDGTTTADTLTAATTGAYVSQNATFTGDGDKAYSVFLKAGTSTTTRLILRDTTSSVNRGGVDITWTAGVPSGVASVGTLQGIDSFGNGWYRVRMLATGVVAANTNQFRFSPDPSAGTGTSIMWGAQAENGAFATSYIPTVASTVTRSADVATMTGANFSSWYNQSAGTFVVQWDAIGYSANQMLLAVSDGGSTNLVQQYLVGATTPRFLVRTSGVDQAALDGVSSATAVNKMAIAYKTDDFASVVNGAAAATDTSGSVPAVDRVGIGSRLAYFVWNGHFRRIAYYPQRLPNYQLQGLTA